MKINQEQLKCIDEQLRLLNLNEKQIGKRLVVEFNEDMSSYKLYYENINK